MRILLAGHFSYFIRTLRDRFRKEGHEVFWLSGADYTTAKEKDFSWQYDFGFETPSMPEIINSSEPDVVIFLGAQDPYYGDFTDGEKTREYTSGLINILQTTYNSSNKEVRFIYLSSEEVFSGCKEGVYTEDTKSTAYDSRGKAIRQGELAVLSYRDSFMAPVYVLRLDHLFGQPVSGEDMPPVLRPMIRTAIRDDRIDASANTGYGMLSEDDAAFFIYRLSVAPSPEKNIYHLGSEDYVEEKDLAAAVNEGFRGTLTIEEHDYGMGSHRRLDPGAFFTEFNTHAFHRPLDRAEEIAEEIYHHRKKYDETSNGKTVGIRQGLKVLAGLLVPFIENAIVFMLVFALSTHISGGSYFRYVDFYLLYVLLFAVTFGQQQAAFSAILATIGFVYERQLTMTGFEVVVDYNTYIWIAQIFIVGLVVGNLKDRITITKEESSRQIEYLKSRLSDVETVNTANVRIKGVLEKQIINQDDSLGKIYRITSQLDNSSPVEVLFDAAQVIEELMDVKDVAIYQVANGDYARLFASTSQISRSMGNSLKYTSYPEITQALVEKKVFINREMKKDLPMMASAVWSGDKINVIIMIWGLEWENMTLAEADKLTIIGLLIQNAIGSSTRYIDALQQERYLPDLDVLDDEAFGALLDAFVNAKEKNLTDMSLLYVATEGDITEIAPRISKHLRTSDYLGITKKKRLMILLSNTDYANALRVQNRLRENGIDTIIVGENTDES